MDNRLSHVIESVGLNAENSANRASVLTDCQYIQLSLNKNGGPEGNFTVAIGYLERL